MKTFILGVTLSIIGTLGILFTSYSVFINQISAYNAIEEPVVATKHQSSILNQINEYRTSQGLKTLRLNEKLNVSAQLKADEMFKFNYFAHNNPQGEEPWRHFDIAGYDYTKAGENLARCYTDDKEMVEAWVKSPKHHEVMTDDYKDLGIGISHYYSGCRIIVTHYGR